MRNNMIRRDEMMNVGRSRGCWTFGPLRENLDGWRCIPLRTLMATALNVVILIFRLQGPSEAADKANKSETSEEPRLDTANQTCW